MQVHDVIASALALPSHERLAVMSAIHVSLADPSVDHGPQEAASEVASTWDAEIARRLDDVDEERVPMVPAEEAERMIRGDARPSI